MTRIKRKAYTVLEMVVVLAILLLLGAVIVPSLAGYEGNTKQRGTADLLRTRLAEARAKAMERGVPMRVAINGDKTRIRVAADGDTFDSIAADNPPAPDSQATEDTMDPEVTLELVLDPEDDRLTPSAGGWLTITTIKANGDTREPRPVVVSVKQKDFKPIQIQVHGLTGQTRTLRGQQTNGSQP